MINWLRKKLGIVTVEENVTHLFNDANKIFSRLDKIENKMPAKKSQRHDEIERERKRRKKDHLRGKGK